MAPISLPLLLLLTMFISSHSQLGGDLKQTTLSYYFQDRPSGPNATTLAITGIAGRQWNYTSFGSVLATDDSMTETFDRNSAEIGRGQAVLVNSAFDGSTFTLLMSIVFTSKEYKGSTLQIQGADQQFESPRESAVVGGTGKFRFARGYVTFENFHVEKYYDVVRCNISVQHY